MSVVMRGVLVFVRYYGVEASFSVVPEDHGIEWRSAAAAELGKNRGISRRRGCMGGQNTMGDYCTSYSNNGGGVMAAEVDEQRRGKATGSVSNRMLISAGEDAVQAGGPITGGGGARGGAGWWQVGRITVLPWPGQEGLDGLRVWDIACVCVTVLYHGHRRGGVWVSE
jgi:hypothetical protein